MGVAVHSAYSARSHSSSSGKTGRTGRNFFVCMRSIEFRSMDAPPGHHCSRSGRALVRARRIGIGRMVQHRDQLCDGGLDRRRRARTSHGDFACLILPLDGAQA